MSAATHPFTYIDPVCGKPSFHTVGVPLPTDPIIAHRYERLDGRPTLTTDPFVCESCGRGFWPPAETRALLDPANYVDRPCLLAELLDEIERVAFVDAPEPTHFAGLSCRPKPSGCGHLPQS
jgi:hypothetical protein